MPPTSGDARTDRRLPRAASPPSSPFYPHRHGPRCHRCGSGYYSTATNLTSSSQCSPCTPGHWCTQGSRVRCGRNTYNERFGAFDQRSCLLCPINSHTVVEGATHASACICDVSYVQIRSNGSTRCDVCPEGGLCSNAGTTLENLTLQSGYWRATANSTSIIRCPDAALGNSACQGGTGAPCKPGLTGAYCRVCVDDWAYYDERDADCKSCALLPPETILMIGLALLLALALGAQCALVVRARRLERERREALAFAAKASPAQVAARSYAWLTAPLPLPAPQRHSALPAPQRHSALPATPRSPVHDVPALLCTTYLPSLLRFAARPPARWRCRSYATARASSTG